MRAWSFSRFSDETVLGVEIWDWQWHLNTHLLDLAAVFCDHRLNTAYCSFCHGPKHTLHALQKESQAMGGGGGGVIVHLAWSPRWKGWDGDSGGGGGASGKYDIFPTCMLPQFINAFHIRMIGWSQTWLKKVRVTTEGLCFALALPLSGTMCTQIPSHL